MKGSQVSDPDLAAALFRRRRAEGLLPLDGDFYPVVHYPGITMYPPATEVSVFSGYAAPASGSVSLYAHIPFCSRYCNFCHYPVLTGASDGDKEAYLSAVSAESALYARRLGLDRPRITSALVGGGTPTCLPPALLDRFLSDLQARFDFSSCSQFSYDVDPGTLLGPEGAERLRILGDRGVGRLTIGLQSFDDGVLKAMNRPHTAAEGLAAVEAAAAAGFRLNVEFIYGYPGETESTWEATMKKAAGLGVEEIQVYRIKLIPYGDHAGFFSRRGAPVDPEAVFRMKALANSVLSGAGYGETLRRVFSREPGEFSRYADDQCCGLADQIGLGLTAFSSLRDRFVLNTQDLKEYYSLVASGRLPVNRGLIRDAGEQAVWALVLPLKNRLVHKSFFRSVSGTGTDAAFGGRIKELAAAGLLTDGEKSLELTPEGVFFADEVCHQFYSRRYMPFGPERYAAGPLNPYR